VNVTSTLQTLIDRKIEYPAAHPKQMKLTRYLAEWISDAVLPICSRQKLQIYTSFGKT
jgi:hypothetical protein